MNTYISDQTRATDALLDMLLAVPDDCLADVALITTTLHQMKPKRFKEWTATLSSDLSFRKVARSISVTHQEHGKFNDENTRKLVRILLASLTPDTNLA